MGTFQQMCYRLGATHNLGGSIFPGATKAGVLRQNLAQPANKMIFRGDRSNTQLHN
ncbi:hypothetical protein H6F77_02590 [Microcoleus sp. FACHB-831]|uniref:hypothetical protein n=1 Tax=Microcoleus sp. FACHB-831 TaxID=2692827 RepID=UPI001685DF5A|nr:hypothetical protein [Microcoleus sp. FACHB-831]MBD1920005.1 hypothetical protein [Microcoleus sp. FACHB-831]